MQPIDYTIKTQSAGDAFNQGAARTAGLMATAAEYRQAQQLANAQQIANEQAMQKRAAFEEAAQNPSYEGVQKLMIQYPELSEQFKRSLDSLGEKKKQGVLSSAFSISQALEKDNPDAAYKIVDSAIESAKNSNDTETETQFKNARDMIATNPKAALFSLHGLLYAGLGGDKYAAARKNLGDDAREEELQPGLVKKGLADASEAEAKASSSATDAKYADQTTRTEIADKQSQISERSARLGLDRDKFNLDFDSKLAELQGKTQVSLSPGMEKMQADSVTKSLSSMDLSNKAETLAGAMEKAGQFGGAWSWVASKSADVLGVDFDVNALRREYVALRNKGVIDGLPPGVATDKDIELVKAGFPSENADSRAISQWLRSFSKVQKASAQREEAQAEWISNVGSLSNAKRDIDVGGVKVPAGTSFSDFIKRSGTSQVGTPAKVDLNYFTQKYAK